MCWSSFRPPFLIFGQSSPDIDLLLFMCRKELALRHCHSLFLDTFWIGPLILYPSQWTTVDRKKMGKRLQYRLGRGRICRICRKNWVNSWEKALRHCSFQTVFFFDLFLVLVVGFAVVVMVAGIGRCRSCGCLFRCLCFASWVPVLAEPPAVSSSKGTTQSYTKLRVDDHKLM